MTKEEHIKRHNYLHKCLDELVADFITHTKELPSLTSLIRLMEWSSSQCINPLTDESND